LRRDEGVAGRRMAIMGNHLEHVAQRLERQPPDSRPSGKRAILLQQQVH